MEIRTYRAELDDAGLNILVQENTMPYGKGKGRMPLDEPEIIAGMMCGMFRLDRMAEEYLYLLAMDTHAQLIGAFELSHGTVGCSITTPREVFVRALLCGASVIVLVHNHPSGDPTPSPADRALTERITKSGELLGVKLLDHIVVSNGAAYSLILDENIIPEEL